jgi:hypothetical protein
MCRMFTLETIGSSSVPIEPDCRNPFSAQRRKPETVQGKPVGDGIPTAYDGMRGTDLV